jgi:AbiV family abortive infection protein
MKPLNAMSPEERRVEFARKNRLLDLYGACMSNAGRLIEEAKVLLKHNSFPRAAFLAYCCLEETGKAQIVADFYHGDITEIDFRKYFFSHPIKAAYVGREVHLSGTPDERGTMLIDKFSMLIDRQEGNKRRELREPSLYVGFSDDFSPLMPEKEIDQETAEAAVANVFRTWRNIVEMDAICEGIGARGHFK